MFVNQLRKEESVLYSYSSFSEVFPMTFGRAQKRQKQIVEATIDILAEDGIDRLTFDVVADRCGVTRPLVRHYYKNRDELLDVVLKYIGVNMQHFIIESLKKTSKDAKLQFFQYVKAHFDWAVEFKKHLQIILYFFYRTSLYSEESRRKDRAVNIDLINVGFERIQELIREVSEKPLLPGVAKAVQNLLTGAIISTVLEDYDKHELNKLCKETVDACLAIAGESSLSKN
ncbi:MAG: TetR/AcrR family transcriptional regulator [Bacteriovoracia bacterium]